MRYSKAVMGMTLAIAGAALGPESATAQACTSVMGQTCGTPACTVTAGAGTQIECVRTAVLGENLSSVSRFHYNAAFCSYAANLTNDTVMFLARDPSANMAAKGCSWNISQQDTAFSCTCSLSNADGLPVELLEFAVEE